MATRYKEPVKKSKQNNGDNININSYSKKSDKKGVFRFIPATIQLVMSVIFAFYMIKADLIPDKYVMIVFGVLTILFAITLAMGFIKKKIALVVSLVLCILVTVVSIVSTYAFITVINVFSSVSSVTYETSSMAVIVTIDDEAEDILDTQDYVFSTQTFTDTENNTLMIEEIEGVLEQSIEVVEYDNMIDQATALLNGEVDAMIINEAFTSLLEENLDDYADGVKIIYNYGIEIEVVTTTDATELDEETISELSVSEEPFNIYISGIDTSGSISNTSRSDVNIIMSVNPVTKEILLVTTPRDYYVTFPDVTGDSYDKLTHAGIYGVDVSIATLENLYDIEIDYYAKVNYTSLITIVDALGGIDVYSEYSFTTSSGLYYFSKGMNNMSGAEAIAFSRERYAFSDGDNQRGKNQQQVVIGVLNKVLSPSILSGITDIIASVSSNVQTNMSDADMSELIKMQLDDGAEWTITTMSATGTDSKNSCYSLGGANAYVMVPDEDSIDAIKEAIADLFGE